MEDRYSQASSLFKLIGTLQHSSVTIPVNIFNNRLNNVQNRVVGFLRELLKIPLDLLILY
jgi:hypothetical protein